MHVVEDVILAEAVIPGALAAIAELEVGVVCIRPAADGALVVVRRLLCLLRPLLGLPELHGLTGCLVLRPLAEVVDLRPDEHREVQQRHHRQHHVGPVMRADAPDDVKGEQRAVQIRQPLHLHREDEEQQHRGVREQEGEGKEHGQVHVARARHRQVGVAGEQAGQHRAQHRQQHTAEVVEVELGGAPLALQGRADPVVEIQGDEQAQRRGVARHEHEGDDAPDLAVEQGVQVERQKAQRVGVVALGQQHEDVHRHVAGDDDAHQVGNAETGMRRAEPLHPIIQFFQGEDPPVVTWYKEIVPSIAHKRPKVMSFF